MILPYPFQSLHQEPKAVHVPCWCTKFSRILMCTGKAWNGMRTCSDNSWKRKANRKTSCSRNSGVFPVFNRDLVSWCWRVACWCWGTEEVVEMHSHFPGLWWKMHLGQRSSYSDTWAPLPDLCLELLIWAFESGKQIWLRCVECTNALNLHL